MTLATRFPHPIRDLILMAPKLLHTLLALAGAALGGWLGLMIFLWLGGQGLYGLMIPGALLGVGASLFRNRSLVVPIVCGLGALALGLYAEWRLLPFVADKSLEYFLSNLQALKPITIIMISVGALFAFWLPFSQWRRLRSQ